MAVWIVAAAAIGFYIAAIPVNFALTLRISARSGFGAGASVFEGRYAMRSALMRARGEKKHLAWMKAELDLKKSDALPAALAAMKHLLKHAHLQALRAEGRVSSPDAAHTALICGCAGAAEGMLRPVLPPGTLSIRLQPDFSSGESDVTLCGMVWLRMGHIILAALISAWKYTARRYAHGKASD